MITLSKIFRILGLPDRSEKIYTALLGGSLSARQLAESLSIPRPSVYDYLKMLIENGLVVERREGNKKLFQIDDINHLPKLLYEKSEALKSEAAQLQKFLPSLARGEIEAEPRIKFYPGVNGIKQMLHDILWCDTKEVLTMWPATEMVEVLGRDSLEHFNRRRIRQKIAIKAVWPKDKILNLQEYPFIGVGKEHLRELRMAPEKITWDMGYAIYDNKVSFFSSRREAFGFIVHSRDFANLMRVHFKTIWTVSKPIRYDAKYGESFLQTV